MTVEQKIKQCQAGNLDEFSGVYDEFFDKIYKFIYYKTYHRETAEDLTSQVFVKTLEKIKSFDSKKGLFSSWLYRIARNKVIDHYRTQKKEFDITGVWDLKDKQNVNSDLEVQEKLGEVKQYLDKLKPEQKEIVIMRIWDGLSYREISEVLGKSEGNCKMIFSRTMGKLRGEISLGILISLLVKNI